MIKTEWQPVDNGEFNYLKDFDPLEKFGNTHSTELERTSSESPDRNTSPTFTSHSNQAHTFSTSKNFTRHPRYKFHTQNQDFTSNKRSKFANKMLKTTTLEKISENPDELFYMKMDKNLISVLSEEANPANKISGSVSAATTSHLQKNLQKVLQNILRQSSKTLTENVHKPFIDHCLIHNRILNNRGDWQAPVPENRQEWLHNLNKQQNGFKFKNKNGFAQPGDNSTESTPNGKKNFKKFRKNKRKNIAEANWSEVMAESGKLIDYIRTIKANPYRLHNELLGSG